MSEKKKEKSFFLPLPHFEQFLASEHVWSKIVIRRWPKESHFEIIERVERCLVLPVTGRVSRVPEISPEEGAMIEPLGEGRFADQIRLFLILPSEDRHHIRERVVAHLVVTVESNPASLEEVSLGGGGASYKVQTAHAVDPQHENAQFLRDGKQRFRGIPRRSVSHFTRVEDRVNVFVDRSRRSLPSLRSVSRLDQTATHHRGFLPFLPQSRFPLEILASFHSGKKEERKKKKKKKRKEKIRDSRFQRSLRLRSRYLLRVSFHSREQEDTHTIEVSTLLFLLGFFGCFSPLNTADQQHLRREEFPAAGSKERTMVPFFRRMILVNGGVDEHLSNFSLFT